MALFVGEFEQLIDAKHRLAISAALRDCMDPKEDGSDFILVLGPDRHLWLYPDLHYRRLAASMKRSLLPSRDKRKVDLFFAMARVLKADSQGRVVLPEKSMQRAVISDTVTLVGMDDHIEIWPSDEWNTRVDSELPVYGEMLYDAAEALNAQNKHGASTD